MVTGSVSVPMMAPDVTVSNPSEGDPCTAAPGFEDITDGGQVIVTNEAGKTLGVGRLGGGTMHSTEPDSPHPWIFGRCEFAFLVSQVDGGAKFYQVRVGGAQRGEQQFTAEEIKAPLALTIG